jgi:hypothetical protein
VRTELFDLDAGARIALKTGFAAQQIYTGALRSHQRTWAENDGRSLSRDF